MSRILFAPDFFAIHFGSSFRGFSTGLMLPVAAIAMATLLLCPTSARGDIHDPPGADYGPTRKLSRGISNVVFGAVEIPYQLNYTNAKEGNSGGATYGVIKGTGRALKRLGYGLYETVTFLFPTYKASYRVPYRTDPVWVNGGMSEFPPEMGWESRFPYVRSYKGY